MKSNITSVSQIKKGDILEFYFKDDGALQTIDCVISIENETLFVYCFLYPDKKWRFSSYRLDFYTHNHMVFLANR